MATDQTFQAQRGANGEAPLEKDFSKNGYQDDHLAGHLGSDEALKRIRTAGSISISPELFEKIYLSPQNQVKGDLRKTFANPTPLALLGFLLALTPLSCDLMGWRGAGGNGAASTGAFFFFGGLLMILGGLGEWLIGNTFPFVVFCAFGAFWLTFAATLQPFYNAYGAYSTDPTNAAAGLQTVGFNSSFAFFLLTMGFMCFLFLILSLRTNVVFVIIFVSLTIAFPMLAGAFWQTAKGNTALASKLIVGGGAATFVTSACGWWIFFAIMLASMDFPIQLPVGDLSTLIKGASHRAKTADNNV